MDGEGIKQVETLVGNATAQRANDKEVPLNAGAPFYAGDVLQMLAEAFIGIVLAKKHWRLAMITVFFSMNSFTVPAPNGGDGREYHPGSLNIRERRDRESRIFYKNEFVGFYTVTDFGSTFNDRIRLDALDDLSL